MTLNQFRYRLRKLGFGVHAEIEWSGNVQYEVAKLPAILPQDPAVEIDTILPGQFTVNRPVSDDVLLLVNQFAKTSIPNRNTPKYVLRMNGR